MIPKSIIRVKAREEKKASEEKKAKDSDKGKTLDLETETIR